MRFLHGEAFSRTDEALLELLLTYGIPRQDVQPLAKILLSRFGSLRQVLAADPAVLRSVDGIEDYVTALLKLVDHISQAGDCSLAPRELQNQVDSEAIPAHPEPLLARNTPGAGRTTIPLAQSEMPLNLPGQSEFPLGPKAQVNRGQKTIQDVLLVEGLLALKVAHEANNWEEFEDILKKRLGQNSMETRRRYAQSIMRWFFPDGLTGFLPRVWKAYQDEAMAFDLLRWSYLNEEPLMGGCVAEALFPCQNGLAIPPTYFDKYLQDRLGEAPPEKTRERLKINLKRIGFLERARSKPDRLLPVIPQKTSLLLLVHHLFAAKAVRTVELRNLFTNPFWKYLGYKSEDAVRDVFREADSAGLIGKYVVADQLEAVTTCLTLDQFLERKARL